MIEYVDVSIPGGRLTIKSINSITNTEKTRDEKDEAVFSDSNKIGISPFTPFETSPITKEHLNFISDEK
jgi:hypothetical protein